MSRSCHVSRVRDTSDPGPSENQATQFVVGSHFCSEGFSLGSPVVLPLQKPTFLKSNKT